MWNILSVGGIFSVAIFYCYAIFVLSLKFSMCTFPTNHSLTNFKISSAIKLGPKLTVSTRCTQIVRDVIQHKPCAPQCPCDARVPQPILYPQCDQIFEEHPVYRPNAKLEDFNWEKKRGLLKKGCCGM